MQLARRRRNEQGFTLVEIMAVVMIIAIIAGGAVWMFMKEPDRARYTRAQSELRRIAEAVGIYANQEGYFPESLEDLHDVAEEDPWGRAYEYFPEDDYFELICQGKSENNDDDDLIYTSESGRFEGGLEDNEDD